jgi:hypothetical protein
MGEGDHVVVWHRDIAWSRVGDRANRVEPRAGKRRPKPHKLLNQPRAEARAKLIATRGTR